MSSENVSVHPVVVLAVVLTFALAAGVWGVTHSVVLTAVIVIAGSVLICSIRVPAEWERMPVLRLGRFKGMGGPGLFFITPFVETTPYTLDLRVIPYDVPRQKTLTKDNVPVEVDAVVYYQVDNPQSAVLNVTSYRIATERGATTILRDVIGKSRLDEVLSERDQLSASIQRTLDTMTEPWGIRVRHVEIRDVVIPVQLEDAIAREPAAEREKRARLQLAEAENLAAETMLQAAKKYESDPVALQLRSMNMLYEMCMQGRSTIIFIPTETRMGMPAPVGVYGVMESLQSSAPTKQEAEGGTHDLTTQDGDDR